MCADLVAVVAKARPQPCEAEDEGVEPRRRGQGQVYQCVDDVLAPTELRGGCVCACAGEWGSRGREKEGRETEVE